MTRPLLALIVAWLASAPAAQTKRPMKPGDTESSILVTDGTKRFDPVFIDTTSYGSNTVEIGYAAVCLPTGPDTLACPMGVEPEAAAPYWRIPQHRKLPTAGTRADGRPRYVVTWRYGYFDVWISPECRPIPSANDMHWRECDR